MLVFNPSKIKDIRTMRQVSKEEAKEIYSSKIWKNWTDKEIVDFQLYQERLCVGWGKFHSAVEAVLGHPVWSHQFANPDSLKKELGALDN